jgi:hypothetical protein
MSRTADIDLVFRSPVDLDVLLSGLADAGWSPVREGKMNYMTGDFDWDFADEGEADHALTAMGEALKSGEVAGISLWSDEGHGVNLLLFPGQVKVSLSLDLNRRLLPGSKVFADLAWYLQRVVPPLESAGLVSVTAHDTYP